MAATEYRFSLQSSRLPEQLRVSAGNQDSCPDRPLGGTDMELSFTPIPAVASQAICPLAQALYELEIPVLSDECLEEYQHAQLSAVLDAKKPRFSRRGLPLDNEQQRQACNLARRLRMRLFEVRYYVELWGIGMPISQLAGWTVEEGLPVDAPLHVKRKADEIVNKVPGSHIETEVLRDEKRTYDPVVFAVLRGERYCFEVYEEPVLEAKMF